jgi:uncharacterized membrane protein
LKNFHPPSTRERNQEKITEHLTVVLIACRGTSQGVDRIRTLLWIELGLFALLPIFAAAMARGYGEFAF